VRAVCCSVLQCVAVCCGVLRCVAVCCGVLQCVAVCCSVLQCVAVCGSVLQCVAVCCSAWQYELRERTRIPSGIQFTKRLMKFVFVEMNQLFGSNSNVIFFFGVRTQRVAMCTATYCNTLQRT